MLAAWQVIRSPPQSLLYFRPVQQTCCRAVQRGYKAFSVVNAQDQTDIFSRVQEKARQLRNAAVSRLPFRWPQPSNLQLPKLDFEPDLEEGGAIADAVRAGSLGFGFSAGGMLFPYYIGVIEGLKGLNIATDKTQVAGASAGSIIAVCHHSGLSTDVIAAACLELADDCRKNGTRGRLGEVLEKFLVNLLPDDIHERFTMMQSVVKNDGSPGDQQEACAGSELRQVTADDISTTSPAGGSFERARAVAGLSGLDESTTQVAVTKAFPRPKGELISRCDSKADLIQTLLTSCHIPWWFDNTLTTQYRGAQYYDGGLTDFIPVPPEVQAGIRVCCFPSKQISSVYNIHISPDSFEDWPYTMGEMLAWAFEPAEEEVLVQLISKGRADAEAWALRSGAAAALEEVESAAAGLQNEDYPALKN